MAAFEIDSRIASRLVSVLNDCTEWGQISILDALALYKPENEYEAVQFIERVLPRLQHQNESVVMSAVKVILVYLDHLPPEHEFHHTIPRKLAPPLVSMLSSPAEIQYVILRNINLILQKRKNILPQSVRVFFCRFNDPLYVKQEKLEIILRLVDEENYEQVIAELVEYAKEVDLEFSKKAIVAIARIAIEAPIAVDRAFATLADLITNVSSDVVRQASAIALQMLLSAYPRDIILEQLVEPLLNNLESFDDDEARVALLWLIGRFGHCLGRMTFDVLDGFLDTFALEPVAVQAELLTSTLQLFLVDPEQFKSLLKKIIERGLKSTDNADLRERCIIYARILDVDQKLIQGLAIRKLTLEAPHSTNLDDQLLNALLPLMSTVASVYHQLLHDDASNAKPMIIDNKKLPPMPDLLSLDDDHHPHHGEIPSTSPTIQDQAQASSRPIIDLLGD